MMELKTFTTITYRYDDNYYIDIVADDTAYINAWIYNRRYGVKSHMFGVKKTDCTYNEFLEMVAANAPEHIEMYRDEYED